MRNAAIILLCFILFFSLVLNVLYYGNNEAYRRDNARQDSIIQAYDSLLRSDGHVRKPHFLKQM